LLTDEVKAEIEGSGSEVTLDLDQVTLVDENLPIAVSLFYCWPQLERCHKP